MRTTVTLDADVEALLKENARRTRRPFKRVLNEAVRTALRGANAAVPAFVVEAKAMGLRAGLDPQGQGKLGDELEAEAFLDLNRRLEARNV